MGPGWFEESDHFVIDPKGIGTSSSIMDDDLSWVTENHLENLEKFRESHLQGKKWSQKCKYILVPLQLEEDTDIQSYSPYKTMQEFINHVEHKFSGRKIIFKQHPKCTKVFKTNRDIVRDGDFLEMAQDAEVVYGINSKNLLESALMKVPTIAVGRSLLSVHQNRDRLLAALVDRQIPVLSNKLGYWVKPILKNLRSA
jgi:hypothetical protein